LPTAGRQTIGDEYMTIFFEEWQEKECGCTDCDWKGTLADCGRGGLHRGLYMELYCPECSELADLLILPEEKKCAGASEGLTEEQLKARKEDEEAKRAYLALCLQSPDQLPALPDGELILTWDQVEGETVILGKESVIWREPVAYEGFERFERIARIAKEKYGERLKDMIPTDRSKLFLYGDFFPSIAYLGKVRRELFAI
jgi:hypothetical protein